MRTIRTPPAPMLPVRLAFHIAEDGMIHCMECRREGEGHTWQLRPVSITTAEAQDAVRLHYFSAHLQRN